MGKMGRGTKEGKKNNEKMWDILIPIVLVICVLPIIVRVATYCCGYADYEWYSTNDVLVDFYCIYKSYFFEIVSIFALIIVVFRMGLYRETIKPVKIFIPLFLYGLFVVLSTFLSINQQASISGNFESFESCLVLLGYVIMAFFAYQVVDEAKDYKIILWAIVGISIFFSVVGIFQVFKIDFLNFEIVQRLVMTAEEFEAYAGEVTDTFSGNNVYLTLYNPNYAGVFLSMIFSVIFVVFITEKDKKKRIGFGMLSVILGVLIWFTYSRASLVTVIMVIILAFAFQMKSQKAVNMKIMILAILGIVVALVGIDCMNDFKYISKIMEKNTREPLESMTTDDEGIHIIYDGKSYTIGFDDKLYCLNDNTKEKQEVAFDEEISLPMGEGNVAAYFSDEEKLYMYFLDTTLIFEKENGNYYLNLNDGKLVEMTEIEAADFKGLEYLGSARGYIWSRIVPQLKDYIFVGSGPDTFAEVFPQNDYAGKIVYSDSPEMVIEKAHNDYLNKWIQTGLISVICMVVFYAIVLLNGGKTYINATIDTISSRVGFGCFLACISYMVASLVNDSTIQTAPLFWVFAGIVLAGAKSKNAE